MPPTRFEVFHCLELSAAEALARYRRLGFHHTRGLVSTHERWLELGVQLHRDQDTLTSLVHVLRLVDEACGGGARKKSPLNEHLGSLWTLGALSAEAPVRLLGHAIFPSASGKGGSTRTVMLLPAELLPGITTDVRGESELAAPPKWPLKQQGPPPADLRPLTYSFLASQGEISSYVEPPPAIGAAPTESSIFGAAAGPDDTLYCINPEGLLRLSRGGFELVCARSEELWSSDLVCLDAEGTVWFADNNRLMRVDPAGQAERLHADVLGQNTICALHADAAGRLLIATQAGVGVRDPAGACTFIEVNLKSRKPDCVVAADNGDIWVGNDGYLRIAADGTTRPFTARQIGSAGAGAHPLPGGGVLFVARNPRAFDKTVCVGPGEDVATEVAFFADAIEEDVVSSCRDADGQLWLLLASGNLTRLELGQPPQSFSLVAPELPDLGGPRLIPAPDGGLWIADSNAALRIGPAEIEASLRGPVIEASSRPILYQLQPPPPPEAIAVQGVHVGLIGLAKAKQKKALASLEAHGAHVRAGCDQQTELVFCSKRMAAKLGQLSKLGIRVFEEGHLSKLAPAGEEGRTLGPVIFPDQLPLAAAAKIDKGPAVAPTSAPAEESVALEGLALEAVERLAAGEPLAFTLDGAGCEDPRALAALEATPRLTQPLEAPLDRPWDAALQRRYASDCIERVAGMAETFLELMDFVRDEEDPNMPAGRVVQWSAKAAIAAARRPEGPSKEVLADLDLLSRARWAYDAFLGDSPESEDIDPDEKRELDDQLLRLDWVLHGLTNLFAEDEMRLEALDYARTVVEHSGGDPEAERLWQLRQLLRYRL